MTVCPPPICAKIEARLREHGITLCATPDEDDRLRKTAPPSTSRYVYALAERLLLTLPDLASTPRTARVTTGSAARGIIRIILPDNYLFA